MLKEMGWDGMVAKKKGRYKNVRFSGAETTESMGTQMIGDGGAFDHHIHISEEGLSTFEPPSLLHRQESHRLRIALIKI